MRNFLPLVGEHEGARTVGRLGLAEGKTSLPDRCRLLVTRQPADWNLAAEPLRVARRKLAMRIDHFGQGGARHAEAVAITSEEVYQRYMRYLTGCRDYFADEMLDVNLVSYHKKG